MFDRFNWFTFDPAIHYEDPTSPRARAEMVANAWSGGTAFAYQYADRFARGESNAILEFARRRRAALLTPWVLTALCRWQAEGTPEAKRKIRRVINQWVDTRGQDRPTTLLQRIRQDKKIVCEILERRMKGDTVESAVAAVAEAHDKAEETIREIHKEYSRLGQKIFRSMRKFHSYLKQTDPEAVWNRLVGLIDETQTAYFLDLEIHSMARQGRVDFQELYAGWPPPGHFVEDIIRKAGDGQTITLRMHRRSITTGQTPFRALEPGEYLRVDVYRRGEAKQEALETTRFWEKIGDHFLMVTPTDMPWYRAHRWINFPDCWRPIFQDGKFRVSKWQRGLRPPSRRCCAPGGNLVDSRQRRGGRR